MLKTLSTSVRFSHSWGIAALACFSVCAPAYAQVNDIPRLPESAPEASTTSTETVLTNVTEVTASTASYNNFFTDASYVLGPGDELALSFFNVPEYDGERQVSIDGSLNLPLVGKVQVAGFTVEQASQAISNAYTPYLRTPLVTVDLLALRPIQFGISGEISKPGSYELALSEGGSAAQWPTLVEAIQLAGGITDKAE